VLAQLASRSINSPVASDPLIGTLIADRYQILDLLGEGGMGRVYLAEHVRIGRKSAVKVMSPNLALSADAVSRFNREAANAAKLNHPNVAQIYDFGETDSGMLYLAMEFVEGETLRAIIDRDGAIPLARAADLTAQIAAALAAAHHLGIVHRDLKPDNVMIARHHDGSDWVKVVDFGIAKTVQGSGDSGAGSQTVTTAGVSLGTPEYMSPEQLAGERLDNRTDLYSLGLVLFNMLTADVPYPRVTSKETLVRRLTARPRTLDDVAPWGTWPVGLQAALDRALAPEQADRYESVSDFARDVSAVAANSSGAGNSRTVRLSGATQRISPPAKNAKRRLVEHDPARKRVLAVAGTLIVIAALAGGAFAANRARINANVVQTNAAHTKLARSKVQSTVQSSAGHEGGGAPAAPAHKIIRQQAAAAPHVTPVVNPESAQVVTQAAPATRVLAVPATPDAAPPSRAAMDSARREFTTGSGRHRGVGANGLARSQLGPNATDDDRVAFLADEIRGHFARASRYLQEADVPRVRNELRDLSSDVRTMRQLYPRQADSLHVQQLVAAGSGRLVQQVCPIAVGDSSKHFPPSFSCGQLIPNFGRGRQGRSGAPATRPER
jgi:eukaryotic-like serine/threonine-protein kinase